MFLYINISFSNIQFLLKMNKFFSFFFFLLNQADFFRFPLTLTLKRNEKTSTSTGKIITLGVLTFLLYSFIVSDVVDKKNPQILSQDLNQISRPQMFFTKENFTLAFGVSDDELFFHR